MSKGCPIKARALRPLRPITVFGLACAALAAPATASAAEAIRIEDASGRALIALLTGNTLVVREPGQTGEAFGYLYLTADGTAELREIRQNAKRVRLQWSVDERERLCLSGPPETDQGKDCALLRIADDDLTIESGNGKSEHLKSRLLRGAPGGL
ncbi:hypothetical protein [Caenibius sp. WL]|uniref:hypothetical protein n=1 Tax=Caenibius sp. WL TaxID=2872646 RepID=UPI001C997A1A|nr:hypothetical protein [Caenibius sp. WL]QZP07829.1 hypothetical protein K5X80_14450 [Caenibius sp. WL]